MTLYLEYRCDPGLVADMRILDALLDGCSVLWENGYAVEDAWFPERFAKSLRTRSKWQ